MPGCCYGVPNQPMRVISPQGFRDYHAKVPVVRSIAADIPKPIGETLSVRLFGSGREIREPDILDGRLFQSCFLIFQEVNDVHHALMNAGPGTNN